ncbi:MAG: NUDIX domain-containing protein [Anaerolineae bacterium]|nr:NUDIX domain-containing protein [Anaerolineae bacterium]NIQ78157.1 NUDIX domain-containing protein [Anaerolineae bacterium]
MDFYDIDSNKAFLVSLKAFIVEEGKLLVLENAAEKSGGSSQWELPGGLLEIGESLEEGLIREVQEETGFEISVGSIIAAWDHWEHDFEFAGGRVVDARIVEIAFTCQVVAGEVKLSDEHSQFKWASREELQKLDYAPNSREAIRAYLQSS